VTSAMATEMAIGCVPPPLGILVRNMALALEFSTTTRCHLHLLAGPDYSAMPWARRTHLCSRKRNGRPPIALPSTAIRRWGRSWRT